MEPRSTAPPASICWPRSAFSIGSSWGSGSRCASTTQATAAPRRSSLHAGIGDLRLAPKVEIVHGGDARVWWALGAAVPVTFPTGNDLALRGSSGVTAEPRLLLGLYPGRLAVVANGGFLFRRNESLSPGDEVTFGLALTYALKPARDLVHLHAELSGGWLPSVHGRALLDLPLEALGGVILQPDPRLSVYAMGGVGITNGLAVPDFRVLAGVRYAVGLPGKGGARDSDSDGIVDSRDRCPNEPEDYDGFQDDDGCPDPGQRPRRHRRRRRRVPRRRRREGWRRRRLP